MTYSSWVMEGQKMQFSVPGEMVNKVGSIQHMGLTRYQGC